MDFTTEIEKGNIHLYCWENGRKVSDVVLELEVEAALKYVLENLI